MVKTALPVEVFYAMFLGKYYPDPGRRSNSRDEQPRAFSWQAGTSIENSPPRLGPGRVRGSKFHRTHLLGVAAVSSFKPAGLDTIAVS